MALSPPVDPRQSISATQPPTTKRSTIWNIIFTPGGSSSIERNLIRVYEHKDSRFYCAYLTGVTAIRSAVEIIPSTGKLLLDTAIWFVDITSPRGEVMIIVSRDFVDIIHCIKMAIALPFFAIAGLIFPSDVFGLFENLPVDPIKITLAGEKAALAKVIAQRNEQEEDLANTEADLQSVKSELERTDEALTETKLQLQEVLKKIENSKDAATKAEQLRTEGIGLTDNIEKLRAEETRLTGHLASLKDGLNQLEPALKGAQESNGIAIQALETERLSKDAELQRVRTELQQALEQQKTVQKEVNTISLTVSYLHLGKTNLKSEITRLEQAKPELVEAEQALQTKIENQRKQLKKLETEVTEATKKTETKLNELKGQIQDKEKELSDRSVAIERLEREQKFLEEKRGNLDGQCRSLEHKILFNLNNQKTALDKELSDPNAKKDQIEHEVAIQKKELESGQISAKALAGQQYDVSQAIADQELTTQQKELEGQVAKAKQEKEDATKDLKTLNEQVSAARSKEAEIQGKITRLKPDVETLKKALAELQKETKTLETALETLRKEEKGLRGQISEAKEELGRLGPLRAKAYEEFDTEMQKLQEKKAGLEKENKEQKTALVELQANVATLTASTQELTSRETALKLSVQEAEKAQEEVHQRFTQEAEAQKKLHAETLKLSEEAQRLTKEVTAQADAKRKMAEEMASQKATFEEELRNKQEEAIKAQEAKRAEITSKSPKKDLEKKNLDAVNAEIARKQEILAALENKIADVKQHTATLIPQLQANIERYQAEAAKAKAKRDQYRIQAVRSTNASKVAATLQQRV